MKKLLTIVDMQNDFVIPGMALPVPGADKIILPTNEFLAAAKFDKTIATFDTHYKKSYAKSDEAKMFPLHCVYGTKGWRLAINAADAIPVLKGKFSVWEKPGKMEAALAGFMPENTDVFVLGVASDFCVRYAIDGFLKRGYNVTIISDLCRGIENQIDAVANDFNNEKLKIANSAYVMKNLFHVK